MAQAVAQGATLQCSFGSAPTTLNALPVSRVMIEGRPAATIDNTITGMNIPPFAMCTTLSNPTVASATAAALGVLTPMPCVPVVTGTWIPVAPKTVIAGKPALASGSTCICAWGGVIQITVAGTTKTQVG